MFSIGLDCSQRVESMAQKHALVTTRTWNCFRLYVIECREIHGKEMQIETGAKVIISK